MDMEETGKVVLGCAMKVHSALGPGLLESAYEVCLAYELSRQGMSVNRQMLLPVLYEGVKIDAGYRLDLLVNEAVVVELKAVDRFSALHTAQLLSYLKMGGFKLGYLLNFNVDHMRNGIKRILNGF